MAPVSIAAGLILVMIGLLGYFGTETQSPTALIPAALGLVLIVLGALALRERLRKHAMHAAAVVGLLGFLFPVWRAAPHLPTLLSSGQVILSDGRNATAAVLSQTATAAVCALFLGLCVNSFIQARRRRAT